MLSDLLLKGFGLLPARCRERLKASLGAAGHAGSFVDSWRARRLARTLKRPEIIVQQAQTILDTLGRRSLDGQSVMEFGSGFLLAEAFSYAMFGAAKVDAVDYRRLLQAEAFRDYVAHGGWDRFSSILGERRGGAAARDWSGRLAEALKDRGNDWFNRIGIRYVAPFDLLADQPPARTYDLIISIATLEHVPTELAGPMVERLGQLVAPGGAMYHYIHLADHRDIEGSPYGFMSAADDYAPAQHDVRGNGLRASDWRRIFSVLDFDWSEVASADDAKLLPKTLAERFRAYERDDLLVNHFLVFGSRRASSAH